MPMDISQRLTASFCELRANHFHSGIDISTVGQQNIPVKAVADGYVSRIKISAYGYGHAIYLTHNDGHTTVYGHLNGFNDKIEAVLRAYQYEHETFECDITFDSSRLKVRQGEVIAYSGNTGGSGGPHLHFEVRDTKSEKALNPLAFLPSVNDNTPPRFLGLKVYTLVGEGDRQVVASSKFFVSDEVEGKTLRVMPGMTAVGVCCNDYFTIDGRPCGVTEVQLHKDGKEIFSCHHTAVDFDMTRYINAHIDYAEWFEKKRFVQRSYVLPGNQLKKVYKGDGRFMLNEGDTVALTYKLRDYAGNVKRVDFKLVGSNVRKIAYVKRLDAIEWNRTVVFDTLGCSILIPQGALYEDSPVDISRNQDGGLRVGNPDLPLHKGMTISMSLPKEKRFEHGVCIVNVDNKGAFSYLASTVKDTIVTAKSMTLGNFQIAVDSIAPKVWSKNKRNNLEDQHFVMIGISDDLSGIKDYRVTIDGKWQLFKYDYKQKMLKSNVGSMKIEKGPHKLKAVVGDECGNKRVWEWTFTTY